MIRTIEYHIIYRLGPGEPKVTEVTQTAEAAYHRALEIEQNGGITIVNAVERFVTVPRKLNPLTFDEDL